MQLLAKGAGLYHCMGQNRATDHRTVTCPIVQMLYVGIFQSQKTIELCLWSVQCASSVVEKAHMAMAVPVATAAFVDGFTCRCE